MASQHFSSDLGAARAKKSLGQNFLQDRNIARKIVDALCIEPGDEVVEIGPGPGALTELIIARAPSRLLLLEKDAHWARERQLAGKDAAGVSVQAVNTDALLVAWERFATPWKCIGNLPYNVASPLMWEIFSRMGGLTRAVFMIQKEVGQRIVAKPGTGAYGALSVWVQSFMVPKMAFIVPPQVFIPRPKVDSAVLSFAPRPDAPAREEHKALADVLHLCFQQRRKQLGTIFKGKGLTENALPPEAGIVFTLRPERLSPEQFLILARAYASLKR